MFLLHWRTTKHQPSKGNVLREDSGLWGTESNFRSLLMYGTWKSKTSNVYNNIREMSREIRSNFFLNINKRLLSRQHLTLGFNWRSNAFAYWLVFFQKLSPLSVFHASAHSTLMNGGKRRKFAGSPGIRVSCGRRGDTYKNAHLNHRTDYKLNDCK